MSLRTTKGKSCYRRKLNWKRLAEPILQKEFQLKITNRFASPVDEPIAVRYNYFEKITSSTAEEVVGKCLPIGLPNWVSSETRLAEISKMKPKRSTYP